jgi:hypothetical protein
MANPVPAGSDVSSGTYRCTSCSYELQVGSTTSLPPCPSCGNGEYRTIKGGDSVHDPQRRRSSRSSGGRRASSGRRGRQSERSGEPTKEELYQQARRLGVEGRSKMNKRELEQAVGRHGGSRGSGSQDAEATPIEVQAFLEGVNYPVRGAKLVNEARRQGAREDVQVTLERLPDKRFESPTEVSEAIGKLS